MAQQYLTLTLDGITAGDYLQWVRDPDPPALGLGLSSIEVRGEPLGDTVEAALSWDVPAPPAAAAGPAAGLPLTPEVVAIGSSGRSPARRRRCAPCPGDIVRPHADQRAHDRARRHR